jgi:purine-binding chemotaxis protein CheW
VNTRAESGSGAVRCLLVQAGDQLCAIPLRQLRRVVHAIRVTPLPGAAPELLGLAEFGGEPLPVFDLAGLIGSPRGPNPTFPVTVVGLAGGPGSAEPVGLNADAALRFVDLKAVDAAPNAAGIVLSEVLVDGQPVRLVDLSLLGAPA